MEQECMLTFRIGELPDNTPENDPIYIAGDFNGWHARDPKAVLVLQKNGSRTIQLKARSGMPFRYKYTRGSWNTVETIPGQHIREVLAEKNGQKFNDTIEGWNDRAVEASHAGHTITGNVEVIRDFPVPQLNTTRKIWVYLPPDYKEGQKRYPVLYMHDGQNLFDAATSFSSEWGVDETLEKLFVEKKNHGIIVVAPENGGVERLNEYGPWHDNEVDGGGKGNEYVDFLVYTLKPYIDMTFRTLPKREYTGICGSSMGGLISLYGGLKHPEMFSRIAALSSSFWFANRRVFEFVRNQATQGRFKNIGMLRVYLDVGGREGELATAEKVQAEDTLEMFYLLKELGFPEDNLHLIFEDKARHSETAWAHRFEKTMLWLYEEEMDHYWKEGLLTK